MSGLAHLDELRCDERAGKKNFRENHVRQQNAKSTGDDIWHIQRENIPIFYFAMTEISLWWMEKPVMKKYVSIGPSTDRRYLKTDTWKCG